VSNLSYNVYKFNKIIYIHCNLDHSLISRVTILGTRWCIYSIKSSWWWAQ